MPLRAKYAPRHCRSASEMPITEQTYRVLYEGLDPRTAVHNLLSRESKPEQQAAATSAPHDHTRKPDIPEHRDDFDP